MTTGHLWMRCRGGPPVDTNYYWCRKCGCLCIDPSGDPKEWLLPGVEAASLDREPPCSFGAHKAAPAAVAGLGTYCDEPSGGAPPAPKSIECPMCGHSIVAGHDG